MALFVRGGQNNKTNIILVSLAVGFSEHYKHSECPVAVSGCRGFQFLSKLKGGATYAVLFNETLLGVVYCPPRV